MTTLVVASAIRPWGEAQPYFYANTRRATPILLAHLLHNVWVMVRHVL